MEQKYTIYLHCYNKLPLCDFISSAYHGFNDLGYEIKLFEDIDKVPVSKYNIVISFVEDTIKYFKKLDIEEHKFKSLNIPYSLTSFTKRNLFYMTMGEFKEKFNNQSLFPIFIKPNGQAKKFSSGVIENYNNVNLLFHDVDDNEPVMLSNVVNIVSEYRCYVIENKLVGIKHYLGDFKIFPNVDFIEETIKNYENQPIGYTIDFGVTDQNETILIEVNDGWSIGNYGLRDKIYAKLLLKRWIEISK